MKRIHSEKWRERYFNLAREYASWSKDPSTGVGSIAVSANKQMLSEGWNGFPRGIRDSLDRLQDRETKLHYIVHSEKNLIYNATKNGISLDGAIVYVYGLPVCAECAKGLIQAGVIDINVLTHGEVADRWIESWKKSTDMFDEVGISYEWVKRA